MKFLSRFTFKGTVQETTLLPGDTIRFIPDRHALRIQRQPDDFIEPGGPGHLQVMEGVKICDAHTFHVIAELVATAANLGITFESETPFSGTFLALSE